MRINKNIEARLRGMMVGTLSYYSTEARCDGENDLADQLYAIAERISTGTETEEDWLEAIDQIDMGD